MSNICRSALVPYSCKQMFDLVNDVEQYPKFVPFCSSCEFISNLQDANGLEVITAKLNISKGAFTKSFTTKNSLHPYNKIDMNLVDGPFSHLSGEWTFTPLAEDASKIELNLNFEFSSRLTDIAFSKIFNQLVLSMVAAFTKRAKQIYSS